MHRRTSLKFLLAAGLVTAAAGFSHGASAETVRGFLTTPIERAVSAIGGVDYIESTSRPGVSTVNVRLKLNHNSTAALAEVTARLQQVRTELPPDAEPPMAEIQRTDRPYASFYLSFTSTERDVPAITDWLSRTLQPQLATLEGVQRVSNNEGGRPIAMRVWIDPGRAGSARRMLSSTSRMFPDTSYGNRPVSM